MSDMNLRQFLAEVSTGNGTMSFNDGLIWMETGHTLDVEAALRELGGDPSADVEQPMPKAQARSNGFGL